MTKRRILKKGQGQWRSGYLKPNKTQTKKTKPKQPKQNNQNKKTSVR